MAGYVTKDRFTDPGTQKKRENGPGHSPNNQGEKEAGESPGPCASQGAALKGDIDRSYVV